MKYYLICGETSGDLHASNLVRWIAAHDSEAQFRAWGGNHLKNACIPVVKELHELNFMGFVEVLMHLRTIRKNFRFAYRDILSYNPDVLILVDFPGFNLRLAKWAKSKGIKVFYYISPTVWAWHQSRVYQIKKYVDKLFVILPFEKEFYKKFEIEVEYHGHPILDALQKELSKEKYLETFRKRYNIPEKPIIAILPGSRIQEIKRILPVMLSISSEYPDYHFVVAALSHLPKKLYQSITTYSNVSIIYDQTYELLRHSHAAIVTSGTATLETALFKVPQIVCYKTNPLTFFIAKRLVQVKYISLVNLILEDEVIEELIQHDCSKENLSKGLNNILDEKHRKKITENYQLLIEKLGSSGCSERIAAQMVELLRVKQL